jgi:hypothetical protein
MSDISHSNAATFAFIRRSLFGNLLGNPVFMGVNTSDAFVKSDAPIPAKMLVGKYILHALGKLGKGMLGKSSEIENKMFREWDQFAKNEGIADANVMSEMQGVGVPWKAGDKGYIPQFIQKVAGGKGYEALGKLTSLFPRGVEQQEQINNRAIFLLSLEKELIKDRAAFKKVFKVNKFALEQLRELEADNPEAFKAAKDAARIETAKLQNVGNWIGSNSASGMALKHALGRDSYGWNMLSLSTMFYGYPVNMMRQVVDRIAKQGPDTTIPKIAAPLLTPMLWAAGLYTLGNAAASLSAGGNPEEEATVAKAVARGVKELARTVLYGGAKAVAKGEVPWTALETAAGAAIPGFNAIRKPIKFLASKSQG